MVVALRSGGLCGMWWFGTVFHVGARDGGSIGRGTAYRRDRAGTTASAT
jgi:hypothetical protein